MSFLESLQQSAIGQWVQASDYGYYTCLAFHAIGMAMVVGAIYMAGLRILGFAKDQPLRQFEMLFKVAWFGFIINAISGVALFMANGENLIRDVPFLLKIALIVAGGFLQWMLWRTVETEQVVASDVYVASSGKAKALAVITMACWTLAIMSGRIIAYTIDY